MVGYGTEIMAGIAIVSAIAGTGATVYSAQSQKAWNDYNASVARQQGQAVQAESQILADRKRREGEALRGKQTTLYAKSGVELEGSPTDVILGSQADIEEDAMTILRKGQAAALGYSSQAAMDEMKATAANTAGYFSAGSTLLTGAGRAAGAYYKIPYYSADPGA